MRDVWILSAILAVVLLVCLVADSLDQSIAQTARPFTLSVEGGWIVVKQDWRKMYLRRDAITSFTVKNEDELRPQGHPVVSMTLAGQEYRLDCPDMDHAVQFQTLVVGK